MQGFSHTNWAFFGMARPFTLATKATGIMSLCRATIVFVVRSGPIFVAATAISSLSHAFVANVNGSLYNVRVEATHWLSDEAITIPVRNLQAGNKKEQKLNDVTHVGCTQTMFHRSFATIALPAHGRRSLFSGVQTSVNLSTLYSLSLCLCLHPPALDALVF